MSLSNQVEWVSGTTLFRRPTGHNDVYWCHSLSGPVVILGKGNVCSRCGQHLADDPNVHSFVAHVEMGKPEPSVYEKRGVLTV